MSKAGKKCHSAIFLSYRLAGFLQFERLSRGCLKIQGSHEDKEGSYDPCCFLEQWWPFKHPFIVGRGFSLFQYLVDASRFS